MPTNAENNMLQTALSNMNAMDVRARKVRHIVEQRRKQQSSVRLECTIAGIWYDTFTYVTYIPDKTKEPDPVTGELPKRPWQGFINLSGLIKYPDFLKDPENKIFQSHAKHKGIVEMDGFPYYKSCPKYINALRNCGNNIVRFRNQLEQCFRPEVIQILWPDICLQAQNYLARKQTQRELTQFYQEQAKIPESDRQLHAEVVHITQNKSAAKCVRECRNLGR